MAEERLPKIEILVSPVFDVLTALAAVGKHHECEEDEIDLVSGLQATEIIKRLRAGLRPRLLANLDLFFDVDVYPGLGLISVVKDWGALDVPGFLQALYHKPLGEFARAMLSYGKIYRGNRLFGRTIEELMSDRQLLVEHIEQNMSAPAEKVNTLADLIMHPAEARDDLAELIEHFWYVVMAPEAEKRLQIQEQIAEKTRARMKEIGEKRLLVGLTDIYMSDGKDGYDEVVLAPSSYYGHGTIGNENPDETSLILVYGPELKQLHSNRPGTEEDEPMSLENLARLYNVLGDEFRLKIIRALAERPYYGQELAKMFGISNATIFYHLSMLMKTGAVHLERIEHRVYYVLDIEQLEQCLTQANAFLLGTAKQV